MNILENINYTSLVEIACIPLIIAVFALAFPILLQTASKIDEKYKSTRLIETFFKERVSIAFILSIVLSLISIMIWFLNLPRIISLGNTLNYILDHSAFLFIFINSIVLVVVLFFFIKLIKVYYNPLKLSKHLEKKYDKAKE